MSRRLKIYVGLLGLTIAVGGAHLIDLSLMRAALEEEAAAQIAEIRADAHGHDSELQIVHTIVASRRYGILGAPTGKVTIYTYSPIEIPEEQLDINMVGKKIKPHALQGIEFLYGKSDQNWLPTESVVCSSEQCETEGRAAFAANEVEIPVDIH